MINFIRRNLTRIRGARMDKPISKLDGKQAKKASGRYRFFLIVGIVAIALWAVLFFTLRGNYENEKQTYIESELTLLQSLIDGIIQTYGKFSSYIFNSAVSDPAVLEIMWEANTADKTDQIELRQELYAILRDEYELTTKYNFRQLHFHLKNGDSFLRFHAPEQYGDNLLDIRESIRLANIEQKYVFGFEEGRIFNGFRFVYPLFCQEEHVGSAEVSVSLAAAIETLKELYPENNVTFVINREIVESTVFSEQQSRYVVSRLFEDYMVDVGVDERILSDGQSSQRNDDPSFLAIIRDNASSQMDRQQPFGFGFIYQNEHFLARFLPIWNIERKPVGYYISVTADTQIQKMLNQWITNVALVTLLIASVFLFFLLMNRNRIKMRIMAETDGLTGIYNRKYFVSESEKELSRSLRYQRNFCLALFDIDHFKNVNDTFGHLVGDSVLTALAKRIQNSLRTTDVFARWGGEEFIVMMPETDLAQGLKAAERIRLLIEEQPFEGVGSVTVSVGVSDACSLDKTVDDITKRADEALYEAKTCGRNIVKSRTASK